jgi:uncharacterized membrane protein
MVYAGFSHFFNRVDFQAQVPDWLPLSKDLVVLLSGIVEIALGLGLAFWKKERVTFGWVLALFFVLCRQYCAVPRPKDAFGALNSDNSRLIRLFFQPVLIAWALWSAGAFKAWRNNKLKLI